MAMSFQIQPVAKAQQPGYGSAVSSRWQWDREHVHISSVEFITF